MHTRRTVLGALGVTGTVAVAGCLSSLQPDVDATANPVTIADDAVAGAGYDRVETKSNEYVEDVEVFPFTTTFESTWWHSTCRRPDRDDATDEEGEEENGDVHNDLEDRALARLDVISTPNERVRDQEVNPIAHLEHEDLLEVFSAGSGEGELGDAFSAVLGDGTLGGVSHVEDVETETLGEVIEVSVFEATITRSYENDGGDADDGDASDVRLYVADVTHDGDLVVAVGFHLRDADEAENVYTLLENLEHRTDL